MNKTAICNKALRKLGAKPLMNVDTDDSKESTQCLAVYDEVLREILREFNWSFAITRQELNLDITAPIYDWTYQFILPTTPQIIKLLEVVDVGGDEIEYSREGNYIMTDESRVFIKYIAKENNPNRYDSIFIDCFATKIASEICFTLTSDQSLQNSLLEQYIFKIGQAKMLNMQENNNVITGSTYNERRFVTNLNYPKLFQ